MPSILPETTLSPEELRKKALALHDARVVRLGDELEEFIKLLAHYREALTNETFEGMGYKTLAAPKAMLDKLQVLGQLMDKAVSSKIKFDKAARDMVANMTPEEERAAVMEYVRSLPEGERGDVLIDLVRHHNEHKVRKGQPLRFELDEPEPGN